MAFTFILLTASLALGTSQSSFFFLASLTMFTSNSWKLLKNIQYYRKNIIDSKLSNHVTTNTQKNMLMGYEQTFQL